MRPVEGLIIGAGPAGLAAALAFARTRGTALVFDSSSYRNEGIKHMHTVPSRDHENPVEFRRIAREQIETRYDSVWFKKTTITRAAKKVIGEDRYDGFELEDTDGKTYQGKKLILATGSRDVFPNIEGYIENWPSHIYQCLGCDGYEQRGTPIGLLEFSPMTSHLVGMARRFDPRITVFSNGPIATTEPIQKALKISRGFGAKVDERKIKRLINNGPCHTDGVTIEFEEGEPVILGFLVHKPETINRSQDLVEQLGLETVPPELGGHVKVMDMFNETSVRGVFAAGDTMVMMKQVTIAMAAGVTAAAGAGKQIAEEEAEKILSAGA